MSELDAYIDVETPEQIAFSYSIAGVGSRALAALIDLICCVLLMVALMVGLNSIATDGTALQAGVKDFIDSWALAIGIIVQFLIVWGYYVVLEGAFDGQTLGKRLLHLRVVRDGGYAISFGASAVRNLIRVIDSQPFPIYLVGIISASINASGKRLGDLIAGTIVVRENPTSLSSTRMSAAAMRATSGPSAPVLAHAQLNDDEYALLERYIQRRQSLDPAFRQSLTTQLTQRFAVFLVSPTPGAPPVTLSKLYSAERAVRTSSVAQRSDTGGLHEQHSIVAFGLKRWNAFSDKLNKMGRRGLAKMPAAEVSTFVGQYREIATDYARLQTASRGRRVDSLFFLGRLVARGHSVVYRQPSGVWREAATYIFRTAPAEMRRSWRVVLLAAALLFLPAIASYVVVVERPHTARLLMPDEMISRAKMGNARKQRGQGYVTIDRVHQPIAASSIITNNIKVTYLAFASGVTFGIGTVMVLVTNGVMIGSAIGVFALEDATSVLFAFTAPHTVLELSAICFGAAGGLLLAAALLLPGARTRRAALVENGKRAIALITRTSVLLVMAGSIEGLISPRVWPMSWKLGVAAATVVIFLAYLFSGYSSQQRTQRRTQRRTPAGPLRAASGS